MKNRTVWDTFFSSQGDFHFFRPVFGNAGDFLRVLAACRPFSGDLIQ